MGSGVLGMTRRRTAPVQTAAPAVLHESLAAAVVENQADIVRLQEQIDDVCRQLGIKAKRRPPPDWIPLREVSRRCHVSIEAARLWCLQNFVRADLFSSGWYVCPDSLKSWVAERQRHQLGG